MHGYDNTRHYQIMRIIKLFFLSLVAFSAMQAQAQYPTFEQLKSNLQNFTKSNAHATLLVYGKSYEGRDLIAVRLSSDNKPKPALLVVAGLDGKHVSGSYLAWQMIQQWHTQTDATSLMNRYDLWVIPAASPDALNAFYGKPLFERSGNARPTDDDRNGYTADDAYEDLNKDGLITFVKVETPAGTLVECPDDARLLVPALSSKGEIGAFLLISEGVDNNKNGQWNEDASEGVNINQNFAYDYPFFQKGSGSHAASESETRALMDFIHKYPNIYGVLVIGLHNNVTDPPKFDATLTKNRIITGLLEADAKAVQHLSTAFVASTQMKDGPKLPMTSGSFAQTAYFHVGKMVMASPGWWAVAPAVKDSVPASNENKKVKDSKSDKREYDAQTKEQITFLKWADANKIEVFQPWKPIEHPDFPGQKAWIGGFKPYQMYHPPTVFIDSAAVSHRAFLASWFQAMPKLEVAQQRVEKVSDQVYRITLTVVNKGLLPTYAAMGDKIRFTSRMKTEITLQDKQKRLSGSKVQLSNALQPNESLTFEWLVSGAGKVTITSGCATAGEIRWEANLK